MITNSIFDRLKILNLDTGKEKQRAFYYRDNRADNSVIQQIFVNQDYSLKRLSRNNEILNRYERIIRSDTRPLIIDAGANIGASAVWFQTIFPNSVVVAIEPDEENISIAKENCLGLNVELIHAAIGSENGMVSITNADGEPWAFRTEPSDKGTIRRISMSNLISDKEFYGCEVFIVKIDIEGAEEELFSKHTDWLIRVPLVIIELHDWLLPKRGTSRPFLRAVASLNRDFVHIGENVFSISNTL